MNDQKPCSCSLNGLYVPQRQLNILSGAVVVILGFTFIGGYFYGKKTILDQWTGKIEQESFADHINTALYMLEDSDTNDDDHDSTEAKEQIQEPTCLDNSVYAAEIIGFGSQVTAQAFVDRMKKSGIDLIIKTRSSRTSKGKTVYWYQVVTSTFSDIAELEKTIDVIAKNEHIKGITIRTMKGTTV